MTNTEAMRAEFEAWKERSDVRLWLHTRPAQLRALRIWTDAYAAGAASRSSEDKEVRNRSNLGPAFNVSKVASSDKFGGETHTVKAHFYSKDEAERVRTLLISEPLTAEPYGVQSRDQARLINLKNLEAALVWCGCSTPTREMMSWWVGREVNRLIDCVLQAKVCATEAGTESAEQPKRSEAPDTPEMKAVGAFLAAMHDSKLSGKGVREAMLWALGQSAPVDGGGANNAWTGGNDAPAMA